MAETLKSAATSSVWGSLRIQGALPYSCLQDFCDSGGRLYPKLQGQALPLSKDAMCHTGDHCPDGQAPQS